MNKLGIHVSTSQRMGQIDALKAICAFLVVCIHAPFPKPIGQWVSTLARIAVPIFFMITGYFYIDTINCKSERKQLIKVIRLIILANLVYVVWDFCLAIITDDISSFVDRFTVINLLSFIFLNESPMSGHLWYLGALLYALLIIELADRVHLRKVLYLMTPVLLLCDLVFGKYSIAIWSGELPVIFVRNYLFVGLPNIVIGMLIKEGLGRNITKKALAGLIVLFTLTSLAEYFLLTSMNIATTREHYFSTNLLAITVVLFSLKCEHPNQFLSSIGQKYSLWLYIIHPIFAICISIVAYRIGMQNVYQYCAPFVVFAATLLFLILIRNLSKCLVASRNRNKGTDTVVSWLDI